MTDCHNTTDTQPPLADEGLRCPECEYNLTGLDRDVCPECGGTFDREQLLAELAGAPAPIPIWSRRNEIGTSRAFVQTLVEIWFHPIRYTKRFPDNPNQREPIAFSRYCLLVAIAVALLPFVALTGGFVVNMLVAPLQLAIGTSVCERLIAATVFMPVALGEWVDAWYQRNLALVRMTRAFLVLSAVGVSIGIFGEWVLFGPPSFEFSASVALLVTCYWWVVMVCIAVTCRRSVLTLIIAVLGVPIMPVLGFVSAALATTLIAQVLFALVR